MAKFQLWPTPPSTEGDGGPQDPSKRRAGGHAVRLRDLVAESVKWTGEFLPTPTAGDAKRGDCPSERERRSPSLVSAIHLWPPTAVRKSFPTPTVQDSANNGGPSQALRNTKPLNAEVGGPLSPDWVELLMGWPQGWTSLEVEPRLPPDYGDSFMFLEGDYPYSFAWVDDSWEEGVSRTTAPKSPKRINRLKAIGNGQVPQCLVLAWLLLCDEEG
jgi:DNA (cytosine-5)-methyltransferase 1